MDTPFAIAVIGGALLVLGIIGGGMEIKEATIPSLPKPMRILSGVLGLLLIGIASLLHLKIPLTLPPPVTTSPPPAATPLPAPTLGIGSKKTAPDGSLMMFVPAGEFLMGSSEADKASYVDERPQHTVYLNAFWISKDEVTNELYKKCVDVGRCAAPSGAYWPNGTIASNKEIHPVVGVTWNDALTYAQWIGGRLPTEAEWEKAACWDAAKNTKRVYPWGDVLDPQKANTQESGIRGTAPVGKYSPQGDSPYGISDMAGNVRQWIGDWFSGAYYEGSPKNNPEGPSTGSARVIRGGSWDSLVVTARCAYRSGIFPSIRSDFVGFRVVEPVTP